MTAGKLILLGLFGALVAVIGLVVARAERSMGLSQVLLRLQDTTAQIRVRGAFVLLIGFVALAEQVRLETILGALAAGALLGLIDRDQVMTHPQFRLKLEAAGFGLFSPNFLCDEWPPVRPECALLELGLEQDGRRAGYCASPGDELHPEPYLYVVPWSQVPDGPLWQAEHYRGAELSYADLLAADGQREAALSFYRDRLTALTGAGRRRRQRPKLAGMSR